LPFGLPNAILLVRKGVLLLERERNTDIARQASGEANFFCLVLSDETGNILGGKLHSSLLGCEIVVSAERRITVPKNEDGGSILLPDPLMDEIISLGGDMMSVVSLLRKLTLDDSKKEDEPNPVSEDAFGTPTADIDPEPD